MQALADAHHTHASSRLCGCPHARRQQWRVGTTVVLIAGSFSGHDNPGTDRAGASPSHDTSPGTPTPPVLQYTAWQPCWIHTVCCCVLRVPTGSSMCSCHGGGIDCISRDGGAGAAAPCRWPRSARRGAGARYGGFEAALCGSQVTLAAPSSSHSCMRGSRSISHVSVCRSAHLRS